MQAAAGHDLDSLLMVQCSTPSPTHISGQLMNFLRTPHCWVAGKRTRFAEVARSSLSLLALILSLPVLAQPQPPVTLHYIQRPPYMTPTAEGLAGLTGLPTYLAFKNAHVPFHIEETSFARQLHMLETNSGQDCMIGMFKKPERELFAKYTKPVYQDQPQILLTTSANASKVSRFESLLDLFGDKSLVLLVKLGYSYSNSLDALIERYQPKRITTTDENLLMVKAIKMKMADYMFMAPEEAAVAIGAAGFDRADFKQVKLKSMPDGDYRHIMCSKKVPDEVINKLNAAIKFRK